MADEELEQARALLERAKKRQEEHRVKCMEVLNSGMEAHQRAREQGTDGRARLKMGAHEPATRERAGGVPDPLSLLEGLDLDAYELSLRSAEEHESQAGWLNAEQLMEARESLAAARKVQKAALENQLLQQI